MVTAFSLQAIHNIPLQEFISNPIVKKTYILAMAPCTNPKPRSAGYRQNQPNPDHIIYMGAVYLSSVPAWKAALTAYEAWTASIYGCRWEWGGIEQ